MSIRAYGVLINPQSWIAIFFMARLPNVRTGLNDSFEFRQTQTAWGIREVARHGFNLFHLQLPVLGRPFEIPFEFPVFQNIAGFTCWMFHLSPSTGGRLTSLFFYCLSMAMLVQISNELFTKKYLHLLLPVLMLTPYALEWSDACLIESTSTFFLLVGLWGLNRFITSDKNSYWVIVVLGFALSALIKITTTVPCIIFYFFFIVKRSKTNFTSPRNLFAISLLGISVMPSLFWTKFADATKSRSIWTEWLTSRNLMTWNFGSPESRLVLKNWQSVGARFFIIANLLIVWILFSIIFRRLKNQETWALTLAVVSPPLIFFNLYVVHDYYYLAIMFGLIMLVAHLFDTSDKKLGNGLRKTYGVMVLATVVLSWVSLVPNTNYQDVLGMPRNNIPALSKIIADNSLPREESLVIGCDWDPTVLYYADRKGIASPGGVGGVQEVLDTLKKSSNRNEISYLAICPGVSLPDKLNGAKLKRVSSSFYRLQFD